MGEKDGQTLHPVVDDVAGGSGVGPGPLCSVRGVRGRLLAAGLRPSRRRGQNFLCHAGILAAIVEAADLLPTDVVLEIGAGLGVLTAELAATGASIVAVEIDRGLCGLLETTLSAYPNVSLVCGDILRLGLDEMGAAGPASAFKVVANLPYYLTSPLIERMLLQWTTMSSAVIMVQEEVARRIVAPPGDDGYGSLSVLVGYHAKPELVRVVPASAFWPRPDVRSAILRLTRHPRPPVDVDPDRLFSVVRSAFGQRRKQLRNSLTGPPLGLSGSQAEIYLKMAGIDQSRRAESLSLAEFAALARLLPREGHPV